MTINELNSKLTNSLINYLNQLGHNETGALESSIDFNCSVGKDNDLSIALNTLEYIQYLDDGKFLDNYFDTQDFEDIIQSWYADNLV